MDVISIFILILSNINIIFGQNSENSECLKFNEENEGNTLNLNDCIKYNDKDKLENKDNNYVYCCYLKIIRGDDDSERYCIESKIDQDSIEGRIKMFKNLDKDVTQVSLDCSSNYFELKYIFYILLILIFNF